MSEHENELGQILDEVRQGFLTMTLDAMADAHLEIDDDTVQLLIGWIVDVQVPVILARAQQYVTDAFENVLDRTIAAQVLAQLERHMRDDENGNSHE